MMKTKLVKKLHNRIGCTVFTKDTMEKGIITSFMIIDSHSADYPYTVNYVVNFANDIKAVHESRLVLLKEVN